jgi:hypothetical protein
MNEKLSEIWDELRNVVFGSRGLLDLILPPLLFVLLNSWLGFTVAVWGAGVTAVCFLLFRLFRRQPIQSALGGVASVVLAAVVALLLNREEGFFLPTILTGSVTVLLALVSIVAKRPLVAWSSFITRRWPLDWYWHPRVRPAYTEVTWLWAAYFLARLLGQLFFFQAGAVDRLAWLNLLLGWPGILLLLIITYIYGTWRLRHLGGPSVAEFKAEAPPPWQGQQKGF